MNKQTFYLVSEQVRSNAIDSIRNQPLDSKSPLEVVIQEPKRTKLQNSKMWPLLKDISEQVIWFGNRYDEEDWKDLITDLVAETKRQERRQAPGITGGYVRFGHRTSKMRKSEMIEVIEAAYWFGTEKGVVFSEKSKQEIEWAKRFGDRRAA
ncbi:NinB protein [Leminorella grimontii]|uniref:NinB protein n=1 Tax=Leminorella grimontii TaxID=82981 RepID=A0AAV5MYT6_9GAMM|nr:recombination protein NinB [Leminorella grimontii]KFC95737.1 NinB family recombinase [Leminorella grimontii ATCC 33999 = DSM 5078]GKX54079.1 NinB protein [Leminorella grimontii]VFS60132.1 NinB protein [Leminorella grimontii]